ncbi:MAG: penicillin-binding protein 1C [Paracoccaceae bacterium]
MRAHRLGFLLAAALFGAALTRDLFDGWIARTDLPPLAVATSAEVLDRNGVLLRAFTVADGRWRLDPGPVDPLFTAMLLSYEDRRFYRHGGVDPLALARAAAQALWHGHVVSGGSTLTMQVARLLEDSGTGRWTGKLRQIRLALALERRLSKDQILGLYLRLAPYGGNVEGVRAAALTWFGKEPRHLTAAEAALLVALPQSPETRRPDRLRDAAYDARSRVLARAAAGGLLTGEKLAAAETEPVPDRRRDFPQLAALVAETLHRADPAASPIRTTLDAGIQAALERLAADAANRAGDKLSVAILVADHRTGRIVASVGAADWADDRRTGFIDMTAALRSPGSTLKPFVYGLAFDQGLANPETLIDDRLTAFGSYVPQNFDRTFRGTLTLRAALQQSLNIPAVSLTDALGPAKLLTALNRAGARPVVPGGQPGLAVALGGLGISLRDLVQAYAALARLGAPVRLSVLPDEAQPLPGRILSPEAAWQVTDILAGLPPPPGAAPGRLAYKTGTSYGHRDALAVGFDGGHVAGVWIGRADGSPVPGAFGGELAAPVLFEAFGRLKPAFDPLPAPPPATLILPTGRLPPPLQHFRSRADALTVQADDAPKVAFPPDGAEVDTGGAPLVVKVRDGVAPFVWMANGQPMATDAQDRQSVLPLPGPGFFRLSVIDARGRSAAVSISLR